MNTRHEKKSFNHSVGKVGEYYGNTTDQATVSGIFECLERASEDCMRDKTCVRKFNGENPPAEWLNINPQNCW
jgi:ribosomal protein S12 methylthiotransferase accessory factor YcaO